MGTNIASGIQGFETQGEQAEWVRAHEELSRLARARAALDAEEGRWLRCALREGTHARLGFSSFAEYIEHLFGYGWRSFEEKLRVAEALEGLPETAKALREGQLSWSAARELTRVATLKTEPEWLAASRNRTVRQIEALVANRRPGDTPDSPETSTDRKHVLRFEVAAETLAFFREAVAQLRRTAGDAKLDDDSVLLLMARHILGGPADDGRSNYQIAITVCDQCSRGFQQASGELVELEPSALALAECDAQHIGNVTAAALIAHVDPRGTRSARVPSRRRAKQDISPAVRRAVKRRDHGRCVVPGCSHDRFVDMHHVKLRSEGGAHDEDNLALVCAAHHRALHDGNLLVEGRPSTGLVFRHADGTAYGESLSPLRADAHARVFSALCKMGFREAEVRRALARVAEEIRANGSIESLLRATLALLTSSTRE